MEECGRSKFQFVLNVAKKLTEFSPGKNQYGKPSTVVKIGFCLKGAVEVLIGQTLMNDDDLAEKKAKKIHGASGKKLEESCFCSCSSNVFLTVRMMESIDLLIKMRDEAGVPAQNPYLFTRPGATTNIRGCDCLRKHAEESKAANPELLRSTELRKQVATLLIWYIQIYGI